MPPTIRCWTFISIYEIDQHVEDICNESSMYLNFNIVPYWDVFKLVGSYARQLKSRLLAHFHKRTFALKHCKPNWRYYHSSSWPIYFDRRIVVQCWSNFWDGLEKTDCENRKWFLVDSNFSIVAGSTLSNLKKMYRDKLFLMLTVDLNIQKNQNGIGMPKNTLFYSGRVNRKCISIQNKLFPPLFKLLFVKEQSHSIPNNK